MIRPAAPVRRWAEPAPADDALARRRARPHCVYWLPGRDGRIVRVGISSNPAARMARYERDAADPHTRTARWWHLVAQPLAPRLEWFPDWYAARAVEAAENRRLCPVGNYQDVPAHRRAALHYGPVPVRPVVRRHRRPFPWRVLLFAVLTMPLALLAGDFVAALRLPWPWAPFAAAPVLAVPLGWKLTMTVLRAGRRLRLWR